MKSRKHNATGGMNQADDDMREAPEMRVNAKKIEAEAKERKGGGRAKRKEGGSVSGAPAMASAARSPRKSGGGVFSAAHSGTPAPGRKVQPQG